MVPSLHVDDSLWRTPIRSISVLYKRSEEHTSELQSQSNLVCRLLLEKKKNTHNMLNAVTSSYYICRTTIDTTSPIGPSSMLNSRAACAGDSHSSTLYHRI